MSELIINVALLAVFLLILVRSAMFAIDSIVKFSRRTRISELAAGFVIVAVATSTPEISVAIFSTYTDNVGITLGDIFGSNVTNIVLVAALFLLVSPVKQISPTTLRKFFPLLVAASLIPLFLLLAQQGTQFIGIVLLAAFAFFIYRTFKSSTKETTERESGSPYKPLLFFFIGIAVVITSAKFLVDSASFIAEYSGIRESVIGATIISLGTSLPELIVDLVAVRKRHLDLAVGDIIGSCITNITLVLGLVLVLSHVEINFGILTTLISFAIASPLVMYLLLRKGTVSKYQSLILLSIYGVFLVVIYEIQVALGGIKL